MASDWTDTPFVSDNWTVDWIDVGTTSITIVLTAFFSSIADIVGTAFEAFLLKPVWRVQIFLLGVVESIFEPIEYGLTFEPALGFAWDFGYVAGLLIVIVGAYIIARAVGVVRGGAQ